MPNGVSSLLNMAWLFLSKYLDYYSQRQDLQSVHSNSYLYFPIPPCFFFFLLWNWIFLYSPRFLCFPVQISREFISTWFWFPYPEIKVLSKQISTPFLKFSVSQFLKNRWGSRENFTPKNWQLVAAGVRASFLHRFGSSEAAHVPVDVFP